MQILTLLHKGFDDATVARQLGIGHRTVQRKVQQLMEILEAKGRVALGAQAQRLGLLSDDSSRRVAPVTVHQGMGSS
ncbi:LuxR C-terminal-related transcriptional regulator [Streptomyces sp. NPDC087300]|uniref:LuxR C-terminal-related transcriptional regulator n=1 Tax=Streptomyces sp. NPDC087300 TaxID=3365780 RepID=UPI00381C05EC